MKYCILILLLFVFTAFDATAQKKKKKKNQNTEQNLPEKSNSYRYVPEQEASSGTVRKNNKKKNKKSFAAIFNKQLEDKRKEFYERLEANAKRDKKIRRKMEHPMYSDFSYFGHKKPPKKRPVGKRKFCKECGIVH